METDLVSLTEKLAEKENELRLDIEMKIQNHRKWNQNHIDLTRDPLSPIKDQGIELKFRPAKTQYLMTPPASTSSEMEVDEESPDAMQLDKPELPVFQFAAGGASDSPKSSQPAFRRRIGRLNRLWIDRRGMMSPSRAECGYSDRWKYDSDSEEDEPPVYEVDPFDTRAMKFRATIPLNPYMFRPRGDSVNPVQAAGRGIGPPAIAAAAAAQAQAVAQAQAQAHAQAQAQAQAHAQVKAQVQAQQAQAQAQAQMKMAG